VPPSKKLSTTAKIGIGVGAGLVALLGGGYVAGHFLAGENLPAKTSVSGIQLGGLTAEQATAKLQDGLAAASAQPIKVSAGSDAVAFEPADVGLAVDYTASVSQAQGGSTWNPVRILTVLFGGSEHQAVLKVDHTKLDAAVAELAKKVDVEPVNAGVSYADLKPVTTEAKDGVALDQAATVAAIKAAYLTDEPVTASVATAEAEVTTAEAQQVADGLAKTAIADSISVSVADKGKLVLAPKAIAASLRFEPDDGSLSPKFDSSALGKQLTGQLAELGLKQPKNASYTISKGKPKVVAAVDGAGVDPEKLGTALVPVLAKASGRTASVDVSTQPAAVTTADVEKLGVKKVIGKFTTYFPGTAYRYNNIGKAAKLINGTFLMPGETFSMNETLGKRTTAAGWMSGGAIDGGKVVQRMGGGISQATTTTFNAIYFAGLKDIYHKPHSLYFNRYPVGREATLDWESVDMKFKNDSPYGVLLQASITGHTGAQGSVTVKVWSTKRYTIKSSASIRSNYRAPGKVVYDDSDGCIAQSAMSGFDVRFNRLFYEGDKLVKKEPFKWSYNSLTPVVCGKDPAKKD